jgi:hypothetical protein
MKNGIKEAGFAYPPFFDPRFWDISSFFRKMVKIKKREIKFQPLGL